MLTIPQKLEEARAAYHQLNTGTMARVVVDQNGERVEFTAANRTGLYSYIQQLEAQMPCAPLGGFRPSNGPAGFLF
jgi:hypothetical protein